MRTFILTTAAIFLAIVTTEAKGHKTDKGVSNLSKEQFAFDFDHTSDAVWRRTSLFDEVSFNQDGKSYTAFYDTHSQLVGTTSVAKFSDLPVNAQKQIKKDYRNYSVESVINYDDNELNATDIQLYGLQTDAADSYFVELSKDNKRLVVQVYSSGDVTFFHDIK
jgi:FlaG/FlaF family flagellin (archaellin)